MVAIKILPPALRERAHASSTSSSPGARAVATLKHPNVVDVYDIGPGYQVMEYVDGGSLADALPHFGRLTAGRTMALMAQTADALQAAHERGIVHRDVRGENVLVRRDGTAVLTGFDFALAGAPRATRVRGVLRARRALARAGAWAGWRPR